MSETVAWIEAVDEAACAWAGPKMARLGELRRIGVCVPDAFVVPVASFHRFFGASNLRNRIEAALASVSLADEASIAACARSIHQWVMEAPIDAADQSAVEHAYEALAVRSGESTPRVAVRSSATKEDSATASFAGQYTTVLGISGAEAVAAALKECWASFFSSHALDYRLRHAVDHWSSPMAVGVVVLVDAEAAGVAFSAHPVSGKRDRCVVEGSFGWGEAVVQGLVTPDHVELDHANGRVLDYTIGDKRVLSTFDPVVGRVVEVDMPMERRTQKVLSDTAIAGIFEALMRIESHYGEPVDIEWVVDGHDGQGRGGISVVQTRPITTLAPVPVPAASWDPSSYARKYGLTGVR